ncbi:MAG: hypothetical protein PHE93_00835 [Clostridia bacterium]|nr:hypothetical protein [Clostridia bacterium]
MDEEIMKTLLKKATGYTFDEVVEEFIVKEDGVAELAKRKVTTKHYPPDSSALKSYMELSQNNDVCGLTDEELEKEKCRLLEQLKKNEAKKRKAKEPDKAANTKKHS